MRFAGLLNEKTLFAILKTFNAQFHLGRKVNTLKKAGLQMCSPT